MSLVRAGRLGICLVVPLLATTSLAQTGVRTADPAKRGLKNAAVPRTIKITDNVYTYEDFHAEPEKFTTTNMFGVPVDQAATQANWGEYASWTLASRKGRLRSGRFTKTCPDS